MADEVRLAKLLSRRGLASRRLAERWIIEGRVTVDGQRVPVATLVDPTVADVRVDGKRLPAEPEKVYLLMYKPRGFITGRDDPQGRKSVLDLLDELRVKVEPVGRLDLDTEGALLLTNDGDLAHKLTHPSRRVPKRYLAKVYRTPDDADLQKIRAGKVFLDDGAALPALVRVTDTTDGTNAWVEITVTEGRNRLIRRLFAALRHPVSKLRRESFATLSIRGLERGQARPLTQNEVHRLQDIAEGRRPSTAGKTKGKGFARAKPRKPRIGGRRRTRGT
ncbi:MAG: 23S rRNA pseudouridine2605 synthase [Myxococcota bacterium]|jgi:23S rRNA pseudouridine2605 synthase